MHLLTIAVLCVISSKYNNFDYVVLLADGNVTAGVFRQMWSSIVETTDHYQYSSLHLLKHFGDKKIRWAACFY